MDLKSAKREFAVRFYRWAEGDFNRELRDGLPLIASIKGVATQRFLEIWPSLTHSEQACLTTSFLKWAHAEAAEITGEYQTTEERELFEAYRKHSLQECQLEKQIYRRRALGKGPIKTLNRRRFASGTKRKLDELFDEPSRPMGPNDVLYSTVIGPWKVNTWVKLGQPPTYFHYIEAITHVDLLERTDLLGWLGIPGGHGLFYDLILDDEDAEGAAISIATLCSHFIQAVPGLLDGLFHDLPPQEPAALQPAPKIRLRKKNKLF